MTDGTGSEAGRVERLRTAVERHWAACAGGVATSLPGVPLDATRRTEWVELWLVGDERQRSRQAVAESRFTVTVHVFVRESAEARTAERLVDRTREAFERRTLDAGDGLILRLSEAEVRDLTRDRSEESPALLRHLVVLIDGRAEG